MRDSHRFEEALMSQKFMGPEGKRVGSVCSQQFWSSLFHSSPCYTWFNITYCFNGITMFLFKLPPPDSFVSSFIRQRYIRHLLWAWSCSWYWRNIREWVGPGPAFTKVFEEVEMRHESVMTLFSLGGGEEEVQRRHPGKSNIWDQEDKK